VGRLVALGLLLVLVTGLWVRHRIDESRLRQPLEVVQQASVGAHRPIRVISPGTADRWDSGGASPSEDHVRALARPGNAFLEPAFYYYRGRHGGDPVDGIGPDTRCYYFPVQQGAEFDPTGVSRIVRLCYLDGTRGPYGVSVTAIQ
jgi:hypothetical protein